MAAHQENMMGKNSIHKLKAIDLQANISGLNFLAKPSLLHGHPTVMNAKATMPSRRFAPGTLDKRRRLSFS